MANAIYQDQFSSETTVRGSIHAVRKWISHETDGARSLQDARAAGPKRTVEVTDQYLLPG